MVTDTSGAVVAGVEVKLTDTKTGAEQTTTTNGEGSYTFDKVAPGSGYTITFTGSGFQTLILKEVTLGVSNVETYNAQMTVGQVSSTVEVVAEGGATLNTTDASIGNVIDERRLKELPIQIRNSPAALISLQPGVVGNNVGATGTNRIGSVTGARTDQGNITIDGIDANDQATGQFAPRSAMPRLTLSRNSERFQPILAQTKVVAAAVRFRSLPRAAPTIFTVTYVNTTALLKLQRTAFSTTGTARSGRN